MGPFHLKNKNGVGFRYFPCVAILKIFYVFEFRAVNYNRLPIFILTRFWEIRKFLTNGLRESACISFRVEGLFVLRPVADLDFVLVSGLSTKRFTSTLNDIIALG
jgi:hypothetical protein